MKKITVSILTTLLMLSMVFSSSVFAANEKVSAWDSFLGLFGVKASADDVGVEYRGHVQNKGDFPTNGSWIQGPNQLGTVGESLRLEAFWIRLTDAPEGLHIKYEVHVQNIGWMDPVEDGKLAGTQGDSLRIEAIKISLVDDEGDVSEDYTVTYKGHIQYQGDTEWIESGKQLGTTGSGLRLEALEVQIEKIPSDLTAYEAALAAVEEADYTKASWATYQDVVEDNVVTEDNVQSEVDAATEAIVDAQDDLVTKAVVTSATAATQNTITLQGAALNKLAVADITVKNITVSSVVASADGTSATVTLASDLLADTDTAVAVVSDGDTSNFTVKFSIKAQTLAAVGGLFDMALLNQKVGLTLDGVAISTDYLAANGYSVEFMAWNAAGAAASDTLFGTAGATTPSETGSIKVPFTDAAKFTVQVTARKGSTILTSEKVNVEIVDLVNDGSSIVSYKMEQGSAATLKEMNSTTLFVGEATTISEVLVQYTSTNTQKLAPGQYIADTSNKNVISVSGTNSNVITANTPGTANITIKVGSLTKTIAFTVTQTPRVPTTVTSGSAQVNAIIDSTQVTDKIDTTNTVTVLDQFGDPVIVEVANITNLFTPNAPTTFSQIKFALTGSVDGLAVGSITPAATDAQKGKYTLPLTTGAGNPADGKISTVAFTNKAGTNVGSFTVKAIGDNAPKTSKVEYEGNSVNKSNNLNINMADMSEIDLVVNTYNAQNVKVGTITGTDLAGYTVLYDKDIVTVTGIKADGDPDTPGAGSAAGTYIVGSATTYLKVVPASNNVKGTTPLKVYTDNTLLTQVDTTRTITVNAAKPAITGINFKTPITKIGTINYKDVLTVTERSGKDTIVGGISLSETPGYDVCIHDVSSAADNKTIYLDRNRNGGYDAGEEIGELVFTVHNNTTGTLIDVTADNEVTIDALADGSFTYTVWDTTPTTTAPIVVKSQTVLVKLV